MSNKNLEGKCFVGCGTEIQINNFEIGHVTAFSEGGSDEIDNLRPICSLCNKSMGTKNLNVFIQEFGFKNNNQDINEELESNIKNIKKNNTQLTKYSNQHTKLNKNQDELILSIKNINEELLKIQVELKLKQKGLEVCNNDISELESNIEYINVENNNLESKNTELTLKKEEFIKNQLLEEETIKAEIRQELLQQQKKDKLKLQVMKEMGLA